MKHLVMQGVAIALVLACSGAKADQAMEFVRIACIPEALELRIDYAAVVAGDALVGVTTPEQGRNRYRAWADKGFYLPAHLIRTCKLAASTYRVAATQAEPRPSGRCGAAPPIRLSIYQDKETVVKDVTLGDACGDSPNVRSIEIFNGQQGSGNWSWWVCVSPSGDASAKCSNPTAPLIQDDLFNLSSPSHK